MLNAHQPPCGNQLGHFMRGGVYDVRTDPWLGVQNGIAFIAPGGSADQAIAMREDGEIVVYGKARKINKRAQERTRLAVADVEALPGGYRFLAVSASNRLRAAVAKRNSLLFASLEVGSSFVFVSPKCDSDGAESVAYKLEPSDKRRRSVGVLAFRYEGDPEDTCRSVMQSFDPKVLMTPQGYAQWRAAEDAMALAAGLTLQEYRNSVGSINFEILCLARALGPRAHASPFDARHPHSRCGSGFVSMGRWKLVLAQNAGDLMDVRVLFDDVVVGSRTDLVSVRQSFPSSFPWVSHIYSELGGAAYDALEEAKAALAARRQAGAENLRRESAGE